jgi:hypothetical protein
MQLAKPMADAIERNTQAAGEMETALAASLQSALAMLDGYLSMPEPNQSLFVVSFCRQLDALTAEMKRVTAAADALKESMQAAKPAKPN